MSLGFESTGTAVATEGDLIEPPAPAAGDTRHGRSPSRIAFDRLRHDKVAIVCLAIVVFFVLVAIFAPLLCKLEGQTPTAFNQDLIAEDTLPPSAHLRPLVRHRAAARPRHCSPAGCTARGRR